MILFLGPGYRQIEELAIKDTEGAAIKCRKYESTSLVQGEPNAVRLESVDYNNKSFPRNQQVTNKIKCKCIENTIKCKLKKSVNTVQSNAQRKSDTSNTENFEMNEPKLDSITRLPSRQGK